MSACCFTKQVTTNLTPPDPAKHVNYVRGMVLEVDEFTQEFAYHSNRDRWLAREVIGYGTLRGLALSWAQDTAGKVLPQVKVTSGVALSPCGQLICVNGDQCADINQWLSARDATISKQFDANATSGELILHVMLAYSDCPTDDAPVPGEPCRSAAELMQPSRITDSFQLELADEKDAPLQAEEDALRGFVAWMRKISIVPDPGKSVAPDEFMKAVRAWDAAGSDPAALTISAADVAAYSTILLRLWVTELRAAVERGAALQRFKAWQEAVPLGKGPIGLATEQEFLAEVRRWTPRTYTWPDKLIVNEDNDDKSKFIAKALALWDKEIAPKWYGDPCGCRAPNSPDSCDDRLLLGTLKFKVEKTAGNPWQVAIPAAPSADTPSVDESRRPILGHLRALQEQIIPTPGADATVPPAFTPLHPTSGQHLALGRVKYLLQGQPQPTPIVGNIKITDIQNGEVRFTFDGYQQPDSEHDYVVQVEASYHTSSTSTVQPAVRFVEFDAQNFLYKVMRSNKPVPAAEVKTMEFQVEVSIIVKPN